MINHRIGRTILNATQFLLYYSVYVVFQIIFSTHKISCFSGVTNSDIY